jgi:methanol metabolism-related c-type cytochrome
VAANSKIDIMKRKHVNQFSKRVAVAVVTCAVLGLAACKHEKKPEDKPAPAPAASTAPAPTPPAPTPPAAAPTPAPTPAPAPAPEPEKKSEAAPAAPATTGAVASATPAAAPAAAPPAPAPTQTAQAEAPAAAPAAPATPEDIKDRTSPPDPVSELAKTQGFKFDDGRYRNKDSEPQYVVTKDYMVDWGTWNGFRRYHDACHVCHGPNALGSSFAPALADSLKTMDYGTFIATVSGGKRENKGGTMFIMPSFGEDRNIMCYIDDIYTYIKARSANATDTATGMPPGRPNGREDISPEARKAANDCTG